MYKSWFNANAQKFIQIHFLRTRGAQERAKMYFVRNLNARNFCFNFSFMKNSYTLKKQN